jgi:hypothetical protein
MKFLQPPPTFFFQGNSSIAIWSYILDVSVPRFFLFILAGKKETLLPNRLLLILHKEHEMMHCLVIILVMICLSFVWERNVREKIMKKEIVTSLMTIAILGTFTIKTCFAQEKRHHIWSILIRLYKFLCKDKQYVNQNR